MKINQIVATCVLLIVVNGCGQERAPDEFTIAYNNNPYTGHRIEINYTDSTWKLLDGFPPNIVETGTFNSNDTTSEQWGGSFTQNGNPPITGGSFALPNQSPTGTFSISSTSGSFTYIPPPE